MDAWKPTAGSHALRCRADFYQKIRRYFEQQGVLEVETPLLCQSSVTDPHIEAITSTWQFGQGQPLFLQTSPEYAMKRLLAAGSGDIFQICKAFRQDPEARYHNPEFSMLEWYRLDYDHHQLMADVHTLVTQLVGIQSIHKVSYRQIFLTLLGLDPFKISQVELENFVSSNIEGNFKGEHRDFYLELLFSHFVEPKLEAHFIYDYPLSQAALARSGRDLGDSIGHRFELFIAGIELANGYWELACPQEHKRRFAADRDFRKRHQQGLPKADEKFLQALEAGLPDCSGVALGLDRLLLLATQGNSLAEVIAFPTTHT